jgi:hypothetical protein
MDACFLVLSGTACIGTDRGTHMPRTSELFLTPANLRHRTRVEARAVLLVATDSASRSW